MNNYIKIILNFINNFLESTTSCFTEQDNIFQINPDEDNY
jgi:hypothetical protein